MGNIHILDISVANLIAAGEVVERPCNAVKELVENAIDAKAKTITVEIKRGGVSFLRVTDDGCGMSGEDAVTAIRRHATSKIKQASDLAAIGTLGFRGEALAAITAVSEYRIITKRREDSEGTEVSGAYGKTEEVIAQGCPDGTSIICEKLFATTPARLKFLKSDAAEASAVASMLEKLAVSHPEIAFRLISDGVLKFSTTGDGILKNAVYSVFGSAFAGKLIAVHGSTKGIRVEGYISSPDFVRGNRGMQHFFINERSVRSKTLTTALEAAFTSYLESQKYPSCVLNIQISTSLVDVNIHPAKLEVKFSDEKSVFDAVYSAVRGTLVSSVSRPVLAFTEQKIREEGNLQNEKDLPKGEQTKLELLFREASEKGQKSEKRMEKIENSPEKTTDIEEKSLKNAVKTLQNEEKTDLFDMKSREMRSMLYGTKEDSPVKKTEIPDDDISVDVPIIRAEPNRSMRRFALASDSDMTNFEMRSRLYSEGVRDAISVIHEWENPKTEPSTTEQQEKMIAEAEQSNFTQTVEISLSPEITDAKIQGEEAKPIPEYRIVGEIFASYVIIEVEEKMILIDKHAAHERINFEKMRADMRSEITHTQMLLTPDRLDVTEEEAVIAKEYQEELTNLGFEYEISEKCIKLFGIPQDETRKSASELFMTLITEAWESGEPISFNKRNLFEKALYQTACKSAIKAGKVYDEAHIRWICDNVLRYDCIKFCPHGRPVAFELSKKELDSRFGRI